MGSPALPRGFSFADEPLYVGPAGIDWGPGARAAVAVEAAWPLAGGPSLFTAGRVMLRRADCVIEAVAPLPEVIDWAAGQGEAVARHVSRLIHRIGAPRPPFAGLSMDRPRVMGIVNCTPDSFSDGGDRFDAATAIAAGRMMLEQGADIVDVGGESTRPGADPVAPDEEIRRVEPVVRALAETGAVVSIDTRHALVMEAALAAGARIVNDVSALADPAALPLLARGEASVVLMHMRGDPRTMQMDPVYACAPLDVWDGLAARLAACREAGIKDHRLCVDPGIGFGKTVEHNLAILSRLGLLLGLGVPVALGVSRKSVIGKLSRDEPPKARLPGSLAAALEGARQGATILRVHDVAETVQALAVARALSDLVTP
ncbi:MAG: dihydropteroate synthase [Alphaproteobacteria bacterium]|nr:dihydropteroate synthase [Alphaproteobacteria bacterium]